MKIMSCQHDRETYLHGPAVQNIVKMFQMLKKCPASVQQQSQYCKYELQKRKNIVKVNDMKSKKDPASVLQEVTTPASLSSQNRENEKVFQ